jgi:hypothetical protein
VIPTEETFSVVVAAEFPKSVRPVAADPTVSVNEIVSRLFAGSKEPAAPEIVIVPLYVPAVDGAVYAKEHVTVEIVHAVVATALPFSESLTAVPVDQVASPVISNEIAEAAGTVIVATEFAIAPFAVMEAPGAVLEVTDPSATGEKTAPAASTSTVVDLLMNAFFAALAAVAMTVKSAVLAVPPPPGVAVTRNT